MHRHKGFLVFVHLGFKSFVSLLENSAKPSKLSATALGSVDRKTRASDSGHYFLVNSLRAFCNQPSTKSEMAVLPRYLYMSKTKCMFIGMKISTSAYIHVRNKYTFPLGFFSQLFWNNFSIQIPLFLCLTESRVNFWVHLSQWTSLCAPVINCAGDVSTWAVDQVGVCLPLRIQSLFIPPEYSIFGV